MNNLFHVQNVTFLSYQKSECGDIIDCVDIYKQPSLQNALLRDHKIQVCIRIFYVTVSFSEHATHALCDNILMLDKIANEQFCIFS